MRRWEAWTGRPGESRLLFYILACPVVTPCNYYHLSGQRTTVSLVFSLTLGWYRDKPKRNVYFTLLLASGNVCLVVVSLLHNFFSVCWSIIYPLLCEVVAALFICPIPILGPFFTSSPWLDQTWNLTAVRQYFLVRAIENN